MQSANRNLAHQNRTIAIASDLRVDGAKSPEIPQKEGVLGSEIAARNRRSLATFHRTLKSQCIIAVSCLGNRAICGVRDGHRNRKSQTSLRFRCAKIRKLEKAVAVSGVYSGVLEENSRESPGKIAGKCFPNREVLQNSRISGTAKGKPAGNLGKTLPGPCPHLPCGCVLKSTVPAFSRKISPKFFRPKFFRGRPRGMSVPKCLFFQDLEGLTEVFGGMSAGMSSRKLPLWAEFSFLIRKLNTNFFFSNFSGACGISRQNPGISRSKSLISLVSRDVSNFLPPPVHVEDPYPTGKYPDQKVWVWVPFSFPPAPFAIR